MKRTLSLLLAAAMALALPGCGAPEAPPASSSPGHMSLSRLALKEASYPEFPSYPDNTGDWNAFFEAEQKYYDGVSALRGEGIPEDALAALTDFSARSLPLAMEGQEGKNAIFSPLSLWSALAMLAQCAEGDSRSELLAALGATDIDLLQQQVEQVWRGLYTDDGVKSLILSNSVWLNSAMEGAYVQETLDTLARKHYADTYAVPMGTETADLAVSEWAANKTNGLIGGDTPIVQTDPSTLALLVSSLYYKAGWTDEFLPEATEKDTFTAADGTESTVDFMHRRTDGNFLMEEGWQAAALSTGLGEMVFLLPDEGVTPEELLRDPDFLSSLDLYGEGSRYGKVEWSVPKFDAASDLSLMETLKAMGIRAVTDPAKADLSALTDLKACLSGAKQLARVKVDEQGVEAAAVTILNAMTCAPMGDPQVCVMDLDRPFLFVIRTQNLPLFVGVVNTTAG